MCLTPLPSFVCVYKFECVQVCVYVDRYVFVLMRFVCVLTGVCLSLCVCVCSQVCVCVCVCELPDAQTFWNLQYYQLPGPT